MYCETIFFKRRAFIEYGRVCYLRNIQRNNSIKFRWNFSTEKIIVLLMTFNQLYMNLQISIWIILIWSKHSYNHISLHIPGVIQPCKQNPLIINNPPHSLYDKGLDNLAAFLACDAITGCY